MSRIRRWLLPSFDLLLLQRCRLLRFVEPGSRVLDAGCGDGTMAFRLVRRGCRVVAVTNDAEAMALLRGSAAAAGVELRLHDLARDGPLLPLVLATRQSPVSPSSPALIRVKQCRSGMATSLLVSWCAWFIK